MKSKMIIKTFVFSIALYCLVFILFRCSNNNANSYAYNKILCDAEQVQDNNFVFSTKVFNLFFEYGNTQSAEQARSGKFSCKLFKELAFGMTYRIFNLVPGDHYKATVWRKGGKGGCLVVAADSVQLLYIKADIPIEVDENGWEKLSADFIVPPILNKRQVAIYVWNTIPDAEVFFDDLEIEYLPIN